MKVPQADLAELGQQLLEEAITILEIALSEDEQSRVYIINKIKAATDQKYGYYDLNLSQVIDELRQDSPKFIKMKRDSYENLVHTIMDFPAILLKQIKK